MNKNKSRWKKESIQIFHFKIREKRHKVRKNKVEKKREVIEYFFDSV